MDLFELVGTVAIENEDANRQIDETGEKGKKAESKLGKAFKAIGNSALAVGKAVGVGMVAAGTAVAGLVTKSIQAYADFEQLVGGAELMFGDAFETVMNNAKNAYQTVQMSQSEYLEQVNGFAVGLKTALGGNEQAAAELSHKIIQAEADIVAATGETAENVQNAFNGIMKSNFSMLDNLKLGITPTKEGFQEVIDKVNEWNKANGNATKYQIDNLADCQAALVDYIDMVGMSGYAQDEATKTITGSLSAMKAAWSNVLVGMSDENADFGGLINGFVDSVSAVAKNLMPRIEIALNGVAQLIDKLAPVILSKVPELLSTLLPSVVDATTGIVNAFVEVIPGVATALGDLLPVITESFLNAFSGITSVLPDILETVIDVVFEIINTLAEMLPDILPIIMDVITSIPYIIIEALPTLINAAMNVITGLLEALPTMLQMLAERLPEMINDLLYGVLPDIIAKLTDMLPQIITSIITLLTDSIPMLIDTVLVIIDSIVEQLPVILDALVGALKSNLPLLIDGVIQVVMGIVQAMPEIMQALIDALPTIIQAIVEAMMTLLPDIIAGAIQLVLALVQALPTIFAALIQAVPLIFESIWAAIVGVFAPIGEWINTNVVQPIIGFFQGLWEGMKAIWDGICNAIEVAFEVIGSILDAAFQIITLPFRFIWENCKDTIMSVWETIKNAVSTAIDAVWNVISTVFNAIKDFITPIWNGIRDTISNVWNNIKTSVSTAINAVKSTVSNVFNSIKSTVSNIFNSVKSTVTNVWNGILNAIKKPIEKARDLVKGAIDKIKGFFNFNFTWPKLKMPHFGISPSGWKIGDLLKGSIPKLKIDWYAEAMRNPMIMDKPTVFGYNPATGSLLAGGEAGSEVVSGTGTLMNMIQGAVAAQNGGMVDLLERIISLLTRFFPDALDAMRTPMVCDTNGLAIAMAPAMNTELGKIAIKKGRGR